MTKKQLEDAMYRIRDEMEEDNRKLNQKIMALADYLDVWFNYIPEEKKRIVAKKAILRVDSETCELNKKDKQ